MSNSTCLWKDTFTFKLSDCILFKGTWILQVGVDVRALGASIVVIKSILPLTNKPGQLFFQILWEIYIITYDSPMPSEMEALEPRTDNRQDSPSPL